MDISYILVLFQFLLYITIYIVVLFQCRVFLLCFSACYTYVCMYTLYIYFCSVSVPVIHTVLYIYIPVFILLLCFSASYAYSTIYMYLYCCSVSVPVLRVSESYVGTVSEKGGQVEVDPPIRADNGPICGYRVSATRSPNIPFEVIYL